MVHMTGFGLDPDALRGAIAKLKDIHEKADKLGREAMQLKPGELTAGDKVTNDARLAIQERAMADSGSARAVARELTEKLKEKIEAYEATLREYEAAEHNATIDAGRVDRQA
ncbi:hypothetical protein [Saccharopolyspora erythraea]|nr:hypothetical protein [Saccharopolyspora erythraea]QRK91068.1 hypothetical protein JQX30_06395 [Saccharopolyspora erythraea]